MQHPVPHRAPQRAWLITFPIALDPRGDEPLEIQDAGVEPAQRVPLKPSLYPSPESRREPNTTRNNSSTSASGVHLWQLQLEYGVIILLYLRQHSGWVGDMRMRERSCFISYILLLPILSSPAAPA